MIKNKWITKFVKDNYKKMSDREIATECKVNYVTIFNIRKKHSLERSDAFNHARRILSGHIGGTNTQKRYNLTGENNFNWRGGISKNKTHYCNVYKNKYPEKYKSRRITRNAIKRGDLIRLPCEVCGIKKTEAHHKDYKKPFDIQWLCPKHHRELHLRKSLITT